MTSDTAVDSAPSDREAAELRDALVDQVVARQAGLREGLPGPIEAAMRAVPRHLFIPGVPLTRAYADDSIVTKTSERGVNLSAVSAPTAIAGMLAQLDARQGQSVLEIGSGGYNAALLAELVGPHGSVTTLDIDAEVIDRARTCLDAAGYPQVRTICADGEFGAAEFGPFDRIILTVGAWDIPPAWVEQLAAGGRIVVPLRTRGMTRSWALERDPSAGDGRLVSRSHMMCGFVPMQGVGEHRGRSIPLHGDGVGLWVDESVPVDGDRLDGVLSSPRTEVWSGVTATKGESFTDQDLWLLTLPDFSQLTAKQEAIDAGLVTPNWRFGTPSLVGGESLAYRAKLRALDDERTTFEFGAYGHGPHGGELAERLAEQMRVWDRDLRHGPAPVLTVHPAATPAGKLLDGFVIEKRHTKIVLSWGRPPA